MRTVAAPMADITSLREATQHLVHDSDFVALERISHLIPFAAGHEIIRQRKSNLTIVRRHLI
jgi:glutaconate CoA-transferase subunit A